MSDGYNYVLPTLAQGSAPPAGSCPRFDTVVLTAMEWQPTLCSRVEVVRLNLDDSGVPPTVPEIDQAVRAGKLVASRIKQGKRVLVTCFAGRNRSGLVCALALVELGDTADNAIKRVRNARGPYALSNLYFARLVRIHARALQSRAA